MLVFLHSKNPLKVEAQELFNQVNTNFPADDDRIFGETLNSLIRHRYVRRDLVMSRYVGISTRYSLTDTGMEKAENNSIENIFDPSLDGIPDQPKMLTPETTDPLALFISHSTVDKEIAGGLKRALATYHVESFVAHEDIEPTSVWRQKILEEIASSDVIVVIVSGHSKNSIWVNQEIGCAMALKKMIIPIKLDVDPFGFISEFQAARMRRKTNRIFNHEILDYCHSSYDLASYIIKNDNLRKKFRKCAIAGLSSSPHYEDSGYLVRLINEMNDLSDDEVRGIVTNSLSNRQVYEEVNAKDFLHKLIEKRGSIIDYHTKASLLEKIGDL